MYQIIVAISVFMLFGSVAHADALDTQHVAVIGCGGSSKCVAAAAINADHQSPGAQILAQCGVFPSESFIGAKCILRSVGALTESLAARADADAQAALLQYKALTHTCGQEAGVVAQGACVSAWLESQAEGE